MILSKKSRYGLRALVDLAVNSKDEHVALNVIAERNGISGQYLEQVFAALRRAGIVKSVKGPQGGYQLKRPAEEITAAQIVEALDGSYHVEDENGGADAQASAIADSIQKLVIRQVNHQLDEALTRVTLADLEEDYIQKMQLESGMYYI